ncbi:hypothetical protein GbCGDNIH6_8271 [Granulibacter bethesdensis]|nr:hypothetical protein GbCGDNIH6_8271 [Granulibacter bethesdensis]
MKNKNTINAPVSIGAFFYSMPIVKNTHFIKTAIFSVSHAGVFFRSINYAENVK